MHKAVMTAMTPGAEQQQNIKKVFDETVVVTLSKIEKYLGDKDYLVENDLSVCDFQYFEQLQFY